MDSEGLSPRRWFLYKHKTELLAEKWHWEGYSSKLPNNWIPTWVAIRAVHKYPISLCFRDLKEYASESPSRLGGARQFALVNEM